MRPGREKDNSLFHPVLLEAAPKQEKALAGRETTGGTGETHYHSFRVCIGVRAHVLCPTNGSGKSSCIDFQNSVYSP